MNDDGSWTRVPVTEELDDMLVDVRSMTAENRRQIAAAATLVQRIKVSLHRLRARRGWPLRSWRVQ